MSAPLLGGWVAVERRERFIAARVARPSRWDGWREARPGDYAIYALRGDGERGELVEVVDAVTFRRRYAEDASLVVEGVS